MRGTGGIFSSLGNKKHMFSASGSHSSSRKGPQATEGSSDARAHSDVIGGSRMVNKGSSCSMTLLVASTRATEAVPAERTVSIPLVQPKGGSAACHRDGGRILVSGEIFISLWFFQILISFTLCCCFPD